MLDSIARGAADLLMSGAENIVSWILEIWRVIAGVVGGYTSTSAAQFNPASWAHVTSDGVSGLSRTIGTSLVVVFFLFSWVRETSDLRNNLHPEYLFKLVIRLVIAEALVSNVLAIAQAVMSFSVSWVSQVIVRSSTELEGTREIFSGIRDSMDEIGAWEAAGLALAILLFSLVLTICIAVSAFQIILYVVKRFFKVYVALPFGAPCLASVAGGERMWQPAISWMKTFLVYNLEAVVIALAVGLSFTAFGNIGTTFADPGGGPAITCLVKMVGIAMPFLSCSAITTGAEEIIRRFIG